MSQGFVPHDTVNQDPSWVLGQQCPAAIELLESFDDLVFEAIAGKTAAVAGLRSLWPEVLRRVGPRLVEESRAQYVQHALTAWRHCVEGDEPRNPRLAILLLDVIDLLLAEQPQTA